MADEVKAGIALVIFAALLVALGFFLGMCIFRNPIQQAIEVTPIDDEDEDDEDDDWQTRQLKRERRILDDPDNGWRA